MRLGVYKKIFGGPETINIGGKLVTVRNGESIIADAKSMMGRRGFSFVQFVNDTPETLDSQPPPLMQGDDQGQHVQIDTRAAFEEVDVEEVFISEEEVNQTTEAEEEEAEAGFSSEVLERLQGYNHRQWFTMKKAEIKKILKEARIDFSHIPDEKWKLLAFLKELINVK